MPDKWDQYAVQTNAPAGDKWAQYAVQSVDLSNSQGQGVYNMWDTRGQMHPVPYGQVQAAAQQGFKFDTNPNKEGLTPGQQFQKDYNFATTGPGNEDEFAQSDKNAPLPMQVVSGVAKGIGTISKPALDVVGRLGGVPQQAIDRGLQAQTAAEGAGKFATIGAAAAPAAIAAPLATAGTAAGGTVGDVAGNVIGRAAGMKPENTALLSDALGIAGGVAGGYGANKINLPAIRSYLRPTPAPSIVPRTEMAARQLSAAIIPAGKDAPNFIEAAQQEVPNILDYAKRTNNPLTTQLEFNKAAQGYAQEVRNVYTQNLLGPVENKVVRTTGTGFGERMNEGQETYATLGEIDNRIVKLNKQLDAPAANADDARRALASREALEAEASGLKTILHDNLAKASGLTPAEVANLRQRVGRSYELANDTNAAVTQRMQEAGKADLKPLKMTELPSRMLNFVRGNQVNVADRQFQRAIANFPGQAQPLPAINPPTPTIPTPLRPSLAQAAGVSTEPAPFRVALESPDAEIFNRQLRAGDRATKIDDQSSAARMESYLNYQRLEQLLSTARNQQKVVKGIKR